MGGHEHSGGGLGLSTLLPMLLPGALVVAGVAYLAVLARPGGAARWPRRRTASFVCGVALTGWALLGPLGVAAHASFAAHMAQHLVVGMLGPFLMVLGAPVRLVLGRGPAAWRPPLGRLLHARYLRVVAHPVVALVLNVGTLPVLYGTGLYAATHHSPLLHSLVHVHFFASGYLFAWVICGPDPAPRRPGVPQRLVVLGVAVLVHASVSQLLYAGVIAVAADPADRRLGATLMYYGGDLVELALAAALVAAWRPDRRRARQATVATG